MKQKVGYGLGKKYWGYGYATEALKCVMEFLVNNVSLSIYALGNNGNLNGH